MVGVCDGEYMGSSLGDEPPDLHEMLQLYKPVGGNLSVAEPMT